MIAVLRSRTSAASAVALAAALLVSLTTTDATLGEWTLWIIQGVLALSLVLVWGHGGIFSLGQAALYGVGGYAYGIFAINVAGESGGTMSALLVGGVVAAAGAALLGYFMFYGNVGHIYVAIITLATSLVLYAWVNSTADPRWRIGDAKFGGHNGLVGVPPFRLAGHELTATGFFLFCAVAAIVAAIAVQYLLRHPVGRIAVAVRSNETRSLLLGYDARRYKLAVFVAGGFLAGVAGGLYTAWGRFIDPGSVFSLRAAAMVIIWVLVGSRTSVVGAFIGVAVVQWLTSWLGGSGGENSPIFLGLALIFMVLFLPNGIVSAASQLIRSSDHGRPSTGRYRPRADGQDRSIVFPPVVTTSHDLAAEGLTKHFGGITAVDGVTLRFPAASLTCLIGPNGAGKSTLFSLLTGERRPSSGRVTFEGRDITKLLPQRRAQRGIGIKLQVASIFPDLPVSENLWLASYVRHRDRHLADAMSAHISSWAQLDDQIDAPAGELAHGQQQWLEIAMVLATEPSVILLDEPTAGMTALETERTAELVLDLAHHATVVVVDHDMDFVRHLDADVVLLDMGSVFTCGTLAELEQDERVLDLYLGRSHAET